MISKREFFTGEKSGSVLTGHLSDLVKQAYGGLSERGVSTLDSGSVLSANFNSSHTSSSISSLITNGFPYAKTAILEKSDDYNLSLSFVDERFNYGGLVFSLREVTKQYTKKSLVLSVVPTSGFGSSSVNYSNDQSPETIVDIDSLNELYADQKLFLGFNNYLNDVSSKSLPIDYSFTKSSSKSSNCGVFDDYKSLGGVATKYS